MTKPTTLQEIGEQLAFIVEHMATKDDVAAVRDELKGDIATLDRKIDAVRHDLRSDVQSVRADIRGIRDELREIRSDLDNIKGFRVEIDHALERIAAIEKHLGIKHEIAA